MTINSDTRKAGPYLGDGATVTLPFGFKVFQAADLRVVRTDSAGVESEMVLGSDFTASLNANQDTTPGGSITLSTPAAVGTRTTIGSSIAALQKIQLANNGGFYADVLNGGLDRLTILIQQLLEEMGRSLRVPFSDLAGGTEMANSVDRANKVLGFDSSGRPAYTVPTSGSAADVALQLASLITDLATASATEGAALSALAPTNAYASGNAAHAAQRALSVSMFPGADPTGATACDTAINVALSTAKVLNLPLLVDGRFRHSAQLVIPARVRVHGSGWTSDSSTAARSCSAFVKDFNGAAGVLVSGDDAVIDGVQIDSVAGRTGDAVQVTGSRCRLLNGASTNAGGDGVRIGKTEAGASSINANCGVLMNWQMLACGGWGLNIDHTNTSTSGTFPLGAPDCNAWTISHVVIGASGQPCVAGGIRFGNTIDNVVPHAVIQDNTGRAIRFTSGARGNVVTAYCEGNVAGGPLFDAGAKYNRLRMTSTLITSNDATDNDGTNLIERALSATNGWASNKSNVANLAGAAERSFYSGAGIDEVARETGQIEGSSGGLWTLATKIDGGALTNRLSINAVGLMALTNTAGFGIGKTLSDTTTPGIFLGDSGSAANTRSNFVGAGSAADIRFAFYNSSGLVGTVSTNGSATTYATSSDYRLKRDAAPASGAAALAAVMSWPIRSFTWRATGQADIGVIAHELQAVKPAAVVGEKDGAEMQGVDYSKLIPELVAAVQHLAARVAALEA